MVRAGRVFAAAFAVVACLAVVPHPLAAAAGVEVVASGLDGPRGVAVVGGDVLVAEAGRGGPGPCIPALGGFEACFGATGAVTRVRAGRQERVLTGLPSLYVADFAETIGPYDVIPAPDGALLVSLGLGADPAARARLGPAGAALGQVVVSGPCGTWRPYADIAASPVSSTPRPDRQPWGLHSDGRATYATDAVSDTVHRFDGRGVRPVVTLRAGSQPTTVVTGPDGALYIGEFAIDTPGQARVLRVVPGRDPQVHAAGFSHVVDLAFDRRGRLYVLEYAKNGVTSGDPTGRLTRIGPKGDRVEIAPGRLTNPMAVAVAGHNAVYVSDNGISAGGGEVLRVPVP